MALEMMGDLDPTYADEKAFPFQQMADMVRERDQYRQALYDATNKALVGSDKVADALKTVDTLHRELHTVTGERDRAWRELSDADRLLDSGTRALRFFASVYLQVGREHLKRRLVRTANPRLYSKPESRRQRRARL
jgi:hypothetical protein